MTILGTILTFDPCYLLVQWKKRKANDFTLSYLIFTQVLQYTYRRYIYYDPSRTLTIHLQNIFYNNVTSTITNILIGVPQGTVLSPILFVLFSLTTSLLFYLCFGADTVNLFEGMINRTFHSLRKKVLIKSIICYKEKNWR